MRLGLDGDRRHLPRRGHFQVERLGNVRLEACDVVVADMAAVLAQMRGDAVGSRRDRDPRRLDGIGMLPAARVAHSCHVIDVDAEAKIRTGRHVKWLR